jgi:hypothetical protein
MVGPVKRINDAHAPRASNGGMFRVGGALQFFKSRNVKVMLMRKDITDISHVDYQADVKSFAQKLLKEKEKLEIKVDIKIEDVTRLIDDVIENYSQPDIFRVMPKIEIFPAGEIVTVIFKSGETVIPSDRRELFKILKLAKDLYERRDDSSDADETPPVASNAAPPMQKPEKPAFLVHFETPIPAGTDNAGGILTRPLNPLEHPVSRPNNKAIVIISKDKEVQHIVINSLRYDPFIAVSDIDLRYFLDGRNSTRAYIDVQRRLYELQLHLCELQAGNDQQAISQVKNEITICNQANHKAVEEVQRLERPSAIIIDLDQSAHQTSLKEIIDYCGSHGIPLIIIKTQLIEKHDVDRNQHYIPKSAFNADNLLKIIEKQ